MVRKPRSKLTTLNGQPPLAIPVAGISNARVDNAMHYANCSDALRAIAEPACIHSGEHPMNSVEPAEPKGDMRSTVLCIEDEPSCMALVEAHLSLFPGVTLIKATTGGEGVRLALALLPDLILLDMRLPDLSGLEVVRALNEPIAQGRLRVILLTAESFSIEVTKAMALGAHNYWLKPLSFERLRVELPRALQGARADQLHARRTEQAQAAPPSVK